MEHDTSPACHSIQHIADWNVHQQQEVGKRMGHVLCAISNGHYGLDISELLEFASHFVVVNHLTRIFQRYYETALVLLS